MDRPIFLIGFMGSGKTTWGKKLARALNMPFVDLDQEIVAHIGMSITEYFATYGEEKFRALESDFLRQQAGKTAVISTGGGTPCSGDNMPWIKENGVSIYLYHTPKSLWQRLSHSNPNKRPILKGLRGDDLLQFIENKLVERAPYYDRADIIIEQISTPIEKMIQLLQRHITTHEQ